MKNLVRLTAALMIALTLGVIFTPKSVLAAQEAEAVVEVMSDDASVIHTKGNSAAIVVAVVAAAGAIAMGLVIWKAIEGIARQPEAEGKIRTTMMLGLVFVETAIIYALIVAILIIFVL
ncbi:MAG: ATP synthase F0 subunit C [Lachnospiraceae bacterium]|nr:ATP synthase F0 subunit C [Lachnospiraceae bacterium]